METFDPVRSHGWRLRNANDAIKALPLGFGLRSLEATCVLIAAFISGIWTGRQKKIRKRLAMKIVSLYKAFQATVGISLAGKAAHVSSSWLLPFYFTESLNT